MVEVGAVYKKHPTRFQLEGDTRGGGYYCQSGPKH